MSPFLRNLSRARLATALAGSLTLVVALGGCAPREPVATGSIDTDGFRSRHPILVEEGLETLDIPIGAESGGLAPRLAQRIETFAREARRQGAHGMTVLVPTGSANEVAAQRASKEITAAIVRGGFNARTIDRQPYESTLPNDAAPIRIAYPRTVARVPHECGQWPAQAVGDLSNSDYWNFGCATQSNIAAMVDNPADLVAPSPIGAPDATRRALVLQAYRKGEKTATESGLPAPSVSQVSGGGQ